MNIVLQQYSSSCYNVWENVDLTKMVGCNTSLEGHYLVHSLTGQSKKEFKQDCHWTCDELYIIKDIYGGFLEFLKE